MKQMLSSNIETWPISEKQENTPISPTNGSVLFPKKAFCCLAAGQLLLSTWVRTV